MEFWLKWSENEGQQNITEDQIEGNVWFISWVCCAFLGILE